MSEDWPSPVQCTADVDGIPMSGLLSEAPHPRATVIAIHGGATTSAYFDCPGHPRLSLLRLGAALGFTVIGLDRPGFGSSAPHAEEMADAGPARRAGLRGSGQHPRLPPPRCGVVRGGAFRRMRTRASDGNPRTWLAAARASRSRARADDTSPPRARSCAGRSSRTSAGACGSCCGRQRICTRPRSSTAPCEDRGRLPYEATVVANWSKRRLPRARSASRACRSGSVSPITSSSGKRVPRALARSRAMFTASPRRGRQRATRQPAQPEPRLDRGGLSPRCAVFRRGMRRRPGTPGPRPQDDDVDSEAS